MDKATTSVSSSRNSEETGMEQVLSDLKALKRLYGLLHKGPADENLDETSRALLMKMLDDATQQALLKQAKMLSGSLMSPARERKLSIRSDRRTRDAEAPLSLRPLASPSPSLLAGERYSRLNMQYSTASNRAGCHVNGNRLKAEEPLLARLASYRSTRTTASALPPRHRTGGEQRNSGLSLYRLSVAATSQHGTVTGSNRHVDQRDRTRRTSARGDQSSQEGSSTRRSVSREMSLGRARLHGHGTDRHVGAESSSSTRRFGRLDSGLSLNKMSRRGSERAARGVATPEQSSSSKTVATIRSRIRPNQDLKQRSQEESTPRRRRTDASISSSDRDDWSSLEGSSRRRSVSRGLSLGWARLHGRGTTRHVGEEGSCSTRRFGRWDSGLSLGLASRRGSERAGRGVASRERHSSSNTMFSSRIMPNQNLKERCLRRAEEEESTQRRGRTDASVSSGGASCSRLPMYISSSSRAAISYPSTRRTVSPESSASASYSPPQVSRRGIVWPVYAPQVSRSFRRRRRQEILQRRVGRLRMLKNKIAMVFHHHYHYGHCQEGPSSRRISCEHHRKSPWRYLEGMFHRTKGQDKNTTSRAVVGAPEKRRGGGGGNVHALFDAMRRHLRGKRRVPASVKMRKMANRSRVQAKKMHWWQRLRRRRGRAEVTAGGRPRRRLGHGKAV